MRFVAGPVPLLSSLSCLCCFLAVCFSGTTHKSLPRQKLEINPRHPLIRQLLPVSRAQPAIARLMVEQLFDNCLIAADMLDQPRSMLERLNKLLEQTAEAVNAGRNAEVASTTTTTAATKETSSSAASAGTVKEAEVA